MADFGLFSQKYINQGTVPNVDLTRGERQGYELAGGITDVQSKIRKEQQTVNDTNALQGFLKSGGDLNTPEGWDKALTDLKGNISPDNYMELVAGKQRFQSGVQKQIETMAQQPEKILKAARATSDEILRTFEGISGIYDDAVKAGKPEEAAAQFEASKKANIERLKQLPGMNNEQALTRFETMTPDQLRSEIRATEHYNKMLDEAAKAKKMMAETARTEEITKQLQAGGPLMAVLAQAEETYGKDSPEYRAALQRLQGSRSTATTDIPSLTPDAVSYAAERILAGDKGALTNLGRGAQGAANVTAIQNEVAKRAAAGGVSGKDLTRIQTELSAAGAGMRTLATRSAKIDAAAIEVDKFAGNVIGVLDKVTRSGMVPVNNIMRRVATGAGSPEEAEFATYMQSLAGAYASVISRGVPTVESLHEAQKIINRDYSKPQIIAMIGALKKEAKAVQESSEVAGEAIKRRSFEAKVAPEVQTARDADAAKIMQSELTKAQAAVVAAKTPEEKARAEGDVAGIQREIDRLKVAPQAPGATPSAQASTGLVTIKSLDELKTAIKGGKLKKGGRFIGSDGQEHILKKLPE